MSRSELLILTTITLKSNYIAETPTQSFLYGWSVVTPGPRLRCTTIRRYLVQHSSPWIKFSLNTSTQHQLLVSVWSHAPVFANKTHPLPPDHPHSHIVPSHIQDFSQAILLQVLNRMTKHTSS